MWFKIFASIACTIALTLALSAIFNFLGVAFEDYGNWIIWMDCLVIFYIILPSKSVSIFND